MSSNGKYKLHEGDIPSVSISDAKRHAHASDVQDILPVSASTGCETTEHRKRKRKPGPKRKNWMPNKYGKYPGSSALKHYLVMTDHTLAPSTRIERSRKIRRIINVFKQLGLPANPEKVKAEHIIKYNLYLEESEMKNSTRKKYFTYLRDYLEFYDNSIIRSMMRKKTLKKLIIPSEDIISLTEEEILKIQRATHTIEGWEGVVARFITVFYPSTGMRPTELRRQLYSDINLTEWHIIVSHPKGENSYGKKRMIGIPPEAKTALLDFLDERRAYLRDRGKPETFEHLIPYENQKKRLTVWPETKWKSLKRQIQMASGVKFCIKYFRSSFCQQAIDKEASLSAVSKVMGHSSSATTEKYYGRIRDKTAINEVVFALSKPRVKT